MRMRRALPIARTYPESATRQEERSERPETPNAPPAPAQIRRLRVRTSARRSQLNAPSPDEGALNRAHTKSSGTTGQRTRQKQNTQNKARQREHGTRTVVQRFPTTLIAQPALEQVGRRWAGELRARVATRLLPRPLRSCCHCFSGGQRAIWVPTVCVRCRGSQQHKGSLQAAGGALGRAAQRGHGGSAAPRWGLERGAGWYGLASQYLLFVCTTAAVRSSGKCTTHPHRQPISACAAHSVVLFRQAHPCALPLGAEEEHGATQPTWRCVERRLRNQPDNRPASSSQ